MLTTRFDSKRRERATEGRRERARESKSEIWSVTPKERHVLLMLLLVRCCYCGDAASLSVLVAFCDATSSVRSSVNSGTFSHPGQKRQITHRDANRRIRLETEISVSGPLQTAGTNTNDGVNNTVWRPKTLPVEPPLCFRSVDLYMRAMLELAPARAFVVRTRGGGGVVGMGRLARGTGHRRHSKF